MTTPPDGAQPPPIQQLALFPTPLFLFDVPGTVDLNRALVERLCAEAAATPGVQRSNAGSWHSPPDLALRPDPVFRGVMQLIVDHVRATVDGLARTSGYFSPPQYVYGAQAWAMVMRDGDYTIPHDHGEAHWSTVYYADAGDADMQRFPDSGVLALMDPQRGAKSMPGLDLFPSTFKLHPRSGMLVLFPGSIAHYVHPYRGTRPRVAVACNLTVALTEPKRRDSPVGE